MLAVAAVVAAACGGKPPPPAPTVSATPRTRVAVDDEVDDGVQVVSEKGHVEPAVVTAAIEPVRDAMTACYLSRVGKRRWLGGQLVLRWEVAADGAFEQVALADNDLGAWPVERCLLELARGVTFGAPIGGPAEVALPLAFSARGTVAVWDDAEADRAVGAQLAKLDACGKKAVAPDDVRVTLYVGPGGKVLSVGFASAQAIAGGGTAPAGSAAEGQRGSIAGGGTAPAGSAAEGQRGSIADAWATCAEKIVLAWHLPDPRGQVTKLAVRYGRAWTSHRPKSSS